MSFRLSFNTISFILILVSFVLLLLATISSPVVTTFNLGKTADYTYGMFGYCWDNNSHCSKATYPITLSEVKDTTSNWIMSNSTRDTLAKIFIILPIALGFNFILLVFIVLSHFTNKGINLFAIVVNVVAMILTILITIIIILVFYPNLAWTSWILIGASAATILSLIFLVLNLITLKNDDNDESDNESGFDKFATYNNQFDDKFNHVQTSTFKSPNSTSSLENDFNYKQSHGKNSFVTPGQGNLFNRDQPQNNFNNNGFVNKGYNNPPPIKTQNGSFTSQSSSYYSKPQTANDFTIPNNQSVVSGFKPSSTVSGNPPYPAGTPNPEDTNNFSRSVFEHHPQVEGHKPFTELGEDDYDDEEDVLTKNNRQQNNDSDDDSDFTSVSQRAINPQYANQYQPQPAVVQQQRAYPPKKYANVQQYQPLYQQTPPQQHVQQLQPNFQPPAQQMQQPNQYYNQMGSPSNQYFPQQNQQPPQSRTTISDNVLNSNPDFNFARGQPQNKRRVSPGFVPVAARYKNQAQSNNNASQLMGRNGASSAGANNGPYGMTR